MLALAVCAPFVAAAQDVPRAAGVKIGEGRLHPFLEIDGRFDSTVGFFARDGAGNPIPSPDIVLHARPGLKFDLQTPSTFVAFNGSGEYLFYTGLLSPSARDLSRLQANVSLDARFNQDGAAEVQIGDMLTRSDRTQNAAVGVGVVSLANQVHLAVPIHPGGRALEITPRAAWGVEFFEPLLTGAVSGCTNAGDITCNPNLVSQMNYSNLNFGLAGRWKFLPKTAVVLDAAFDYRTYFSASAQNTPANVLRVQTGLVGLISPRFSVTLLVGYGGNFATATIHTVIGNAEVAYLPSEHTKVSLGYLRTTQPVPAYGVYIDDRGYLQGRIGLLNGRLNLNATVSADYFSFIGAPRNDFALGGNVGPSYIVTSWFEVSAFYGINFRSSTSGVSSVNFVRHEATLRLNFHY